MDDDDEFFVLGERADGAHVPATHRCRPFDPAEQQAYFFFAVICTAAGGSVLSVCDRP
jgi:hypothetical protein